MTAETGTMGDELLVTDLVARARNGDKQAWDALVERYAPLVWSICRRHRLGGAEASDVGRTVWLRLVDELATVNDQATLPGWLATATLRECGRVLRAAGRQQAAEYMLNAGDIPGARPAWWSMSCNWPSAARRCARRSRTCPRTASS